MNIRIWDGNSIEQCTVGSLLPANSKPFSINAEGLAVLAEGSGYGSYFDIQPANGDFYLQTMVGQGNVAAIFTILVDYDDGAGYEEVAWVRTSTAEPTAKMDLGTGYIKIPAGAYVKVIVEHFSQASRNFYITLGGGLVTGN